MEGFVNRLQTYYPDHRKLLADALAFSRCEIRKDCEDLLRSAKAKELFPGEEKENTGLLISPDLATLTPKPGSK